MKSVTYICCTNNQEQLQNMLRRGLPEAICPELKPGIPVTSRSLLLIHADRKYKSAAEAFNKEIQLHEQQLGDILIFVHQDIFFRDLAFEQEVVRLLTDDSEQILGMAGMPEKGRTVSNLHYLKDNSYITLTQIQKITEVCSLDECCFAMTKQLYTRIRFDEKICSHWHLYAVNFCYESRLKYGIRSRVLPVDTVCHKYDDHGGLYSDSHFLWTIWKMCRKYRHDFDMICTPCYTIRTDTVHAAFRICKSTFRNFPATIGKKPYKR